METDPPPTDNDREISRRTMLKLTGIASGATAIAGCLGGSGPSEQRLGYGGYPWRLDGGIPGALGASNALSLVGPTGGLVGHWPLDGNGDTAVDVAGGNDGAVRGTPDQGVSGVYDSTAYVFDSGADDYVEVIDAGALTPTAALTFGGWYQTTSDTNEHTVLQKADARYGETGYAVDVQTPNSLRAHVGVESGRASVNPWGVSTHDGEWHHVLCTWDGSRLVMYLDGEEVGRDTTQSGEVVHSDRPLYIGYGDNGYDSYYAMDGAIDDVRVYDRALGSDEVSDLYEGVEEATPTPTETATPTPTSTPSSTPTPTPVPTPTETPSPTPTPTATVTPAPTPTPTSTPTKTDPSSQPAPVARWAFAETGGTTVADSAGGNDGFVRGSPTLDTAGVFGTSGIACSSSAEDYVEVPDTGTLTPLAALSFGGWYRTASEANEQTVLQKADARYGGTGYAVDVQTPNSLRAHVGVESGQASVNPWGVSTHDGEWHHVLCTWDGEAFVMYLDGEAVDRDTTQFGAVVPSDRSLYIGYGDNGYASYYAMDGTIDDVRVYDVALTADQVVALVEGVTTEEPTPTPIETDTATATPIPNDEFGESGYGSHGYGGMMDGNYQ
ncbi:hypothetical protein Har1130_17640 [Haloarcula sp. CBA1130]|uniref:LamG domain-containing protein n=1 Tax=unclassified Haloarcula TaxID=2624677 RepID=UPI0012464E38|nr:MULTISPECIES: LamG domain-containing protein [unclassified Haloarcula]KAA9396490.1 hypothetical protein Har1130_17640 [Haloarcula sp. CBA1130]KAA9397653.1 hypothetical protein Har1129_05165 [Haloarcula sp. CBA1129]